MQKARRTPAAKEVQEVEEAPTMQGRRAVGATAPAPDRAPKTNNTLAGRMSENNKRLSNSLLDLMWTLVDNGVVSVDDAAPVIEVLADIIDGSEKN